MQPHGGSRTRVAMHDREDTHTTWRLQMRFAWSHNPRSPLVAALCLTGALAASNAQAAPAQPSPLNTPWTASALSGTPLPEYPRPQMTRPDWQTLNGEW